MRDAHVWVDETINSYIITVNYRKVITDDGQTDRRPYLCIGMALNRDIFTMESLILAQDERWLQA